MLIVVYLKLMSMILQLTMRCSYEVLGHLEERDNTSWLLSSLSPVTISWHDLDLDVPHLAHPLCPHRIHHHIFLWINHHCIRIVWTIITVKIKQFYISYY